jgi:aspartyl-tRNA(Asn)/glutamyl-tRNA(Gln) amidotransferase subunit B
MPYEAVIGMEVHAQLITHSKMFCRCSADYASAPANSHTCPVCLGMPGMLPLINRQAVESTVLMGLALNCEIPAFSKFDRKNYMYPDLPKGYQISQYDLPLARNGSIEVPLEQGSKRIRIRRVHLEEDTAKLMHQGGYSLIDFNRAGVPLMEVVTESDLRTAEEAWQYLVRLRTILRYLGAGTGNMEQGAMRCELNISLRPTGEERLGTKVEVKNMNSFRAVRQAIAYEIERQTRVLNEGGKIEQVTMGWDEANHRTEFQRSKEGAEDYRYFPEPDLPPIIWNESDISALRARLPELPEAKYKRFISQFKLKPEDASLLTDDRANADYFETATLTAVGAIEPQMIANWILSELFSLARDGGVELSACQVPPQALADLLKAVGAGTINATVAKEVLAEMFTTGATADAIITRRGLMQISDQDTLRQMVDQVLAANPKAVQQFREGKETALGFLIGQIMRQTRGQANVKIVESLLRQKLTL